MILLYWRSEVQNISLRVSAGLCSFPQALGAVLSLLLAASGCCLHSLACGPLPASKPAATGAVFHGIALVLTPLPLFFVFWVFFFILFCFVLFFLLVFQKTLVIILGPTEESRIISFSLNELISNLKSICNLNSFFTRWSNSHMFWRIGHRYLGRGGIIQPTTTNLEFLLGWYLLWNPLTYCFFTIVLEVWSLFIHIVIQRKLANRRCLTEGLSREGFWGDLNRSRSKILPLNQSEMDNSVFL